MSFTDISSELAALQQGFAASLPQKMAHLEALLGQCTSSFGASGAWPDEALRNAHLVVHGLAGSAGTFGFGVLGEAAKGMEEVLHSLLHGETASNELTAAALNQGLATLRAASQLQASPLDTRFGRSPPAEDEPRRHERLIYLVEDDAALATSLVAQLALFGYRVQVFGRPGDVVPDANRVPPVVIVMDVGFAEGALAGPQAVKGALGEAFHGVPVLFLSARGDFTARLEAVRAGGVAYFTKPVDLDALVNALDAFASPTPPAAYRVLIVDDSESTGAFYRQVLVGAGMEAVALHDPSQIAEVLTEFAPDLILMDVYMPVCSGIELATLIRQQATFVGIPIVFLSTETNVNRQLVALRQGGDDFLCKPIDPVRLVSVVTSRAGRGRTLRAHLAIDGLTGLLNHRHLKDQLATEIERSQRQGKPLVFAMIDVDHFKRVNDTWGHPAGDRVLRSLAKLLRQRLRRIDVAGRYGGEEFGVILTDIDAQAALTLLDTIRRDFAALRHVSAGAEFGVTFSAGIAEFPRRRELEKLIAAADVALYTAKQAGRDRVALDGQP
ncbi:diguanylate cyclase domain-containing protein [Rhodoferax sp.]|uniref:diguanylate cyclase domain-containing protein n=1 Tax=Rhodoferax sp. TaxID=50421 RepID=UPI00277A5849|nr:diguanylate cyclase [Rhodoferax sp.]